MGGGDDVCVGVCVHLSLRLGTVGQLILRSFSSVSWMEMLMM